MRNKTVFAGSLLSVLSILSVTLLAPLRSEAAVTAQVVSPYLYNFNSAGTVKESGSMDSSSSPYWWVNSGGYMNMLSTGRGSTYQNELPANDSWRVLYASNNPTDTDNGYHPQNIFRLVTRTKWGDASQEAYFVIKKDNLSSSSNRNASNGLLLFNRYQDGDNLYYTGVRVDGSAVIKKKKNGTYYTLSQPKGIFPGSYSRESNPNLLPKNKWIGLRSEVKNLANGAVEIKLYADRGWTGKWTLVAQAVDDGARYGGAAFTSPGYGGIRTDFMDVEFENFRFQNI